MDDYVIAPARHADQYAQQAPELARTLRRSEIAVLSEQFERKDAAALQTQNKFLSAAGRANAAVFLTATISALLLVLAPLGLPSPWKSWLPALLGAMGIVAGAAATSWIYRIREGKLLETWMTARAAAETLRLDYFEAVTGVAAAMPPEAALAYLEYFRRHQLEVQRTFYRLRGAAHQARADRLLGVSAAAVGISSAATGLGGLLAGALQPGWASLAAVGGIAAAASALVNNTEALGQDRRNSERYGRTEAALDQLAGMVDRVRDGIAAGRIEALAEFVKAVHEQLSLEHRQWQDAAQSTQGSIARLEQALSAAPTARKKGEDIP